MQKIYKNTKKYKNIKPNKNAVRCKVNTKFSDIVHNNIEDQAMVPKGPASKLFVRNRKNNN